MAKALCALQLELKVGNSSEVFKPKTPQTKELKRKRAKQKGKSKAVIKLETKFEKSIEEPIDNLREMTNDANDHAFEVEIGDFPTADELAALDADYLGAQCKLGYRAQRIVSLAQSVMRGDVQVKKMEELCNDNNFLSFYDTLYSQLLGIPGFGPFTCANVLMCLGYFHKYQLIVRQYGILNRFELWEYYEETFGKTSDMAPSDYMRITATNMKTKKNKKRKE